MRGLNIITQEDEQITNLVIDERKSSLNLKYGTDFDKNVWLGDVSYDGKIIWYKRDKLTAFVETPDSKDILPRLKVSYSDYMISFATDEQSNDWVGDTYNGFIKWTKTIK